MGDRWYVSRSSPKISRSRKSLELLQGSRSERRLLHDSRQWEISYVQRQRRMALATSVLRGRDT